jgi:hypothetical protein
MSYNMNESRPKSIGLATVLRRAVRKITINEPNLLMQEKFNDNNGNSNNGYNNNNTDSNNQDKKNNEIKMNVSEDSNSHLANNLLKTHDSMNENTLNMSYPYHNHHSQMNHHQSLVEQENNKKLSLNRFKDLFSFSYLQKKHLIKHMTIIDSNENHFNDINNESASLNSISAINLNDRENIFGSEKTDSNISLEKNSDLSELELDFAIEQPDPVAASLLESDYLIALEEELYDKGLRKLTLMENGAGDTSIVLDAGADLVLRLGVGEIVFRPHLEEVLQPIYWGHVGNLRYEILPKVDVINIHESDMATLQKSLAEKGYDWHGANLDNIGIYHSSPIITDPKGIEIKKSV